MTDNVWPLDPYWDIDPLDFYRSPTPTGPFALRLDTPSPHRPTGQSPPLTAVPASPAASDMGPPPAPTGAGRKPKAPTKRPQDWLPFKDLVIDLYREQGKSAKEIVDILKTAHDFEVTDRQVKFQLTKWGKDKNIKSSEMAFIANKQRERIELQRVQPNKQDLRFRLRSEPVPQAKVERWLSRNRTVLAAASPRALASTPAGMSYSSLSDPQSAPSTPRSISEAALNLLQNASVSGTQVPPPPTLSLASLNVGSMAEFAGHSPAPMFEDFSNTSLNPVVGMDLVNTSPLRRQARYMEDEEMRARHDLSALGAAYGPNNPESLHLRVLLGSILARQGRLRSAEEILRQTVLDLQQVKGGSPETLLQALASLSNVLGCQGNGASGLRYAQKAYSYGSAKLGSNHEMTLKQGANLIQHYVAHRLPQAAIPLGATVLEMSLAWLGPHSLPARECLMALSCAYLDAGQFSKAEECGVQVLKEEVAFYKPDDVSFWHKQMTVGSMYLELGNLQMARSLLEPTYTNTKRLVGIAHYAAVVAGFHLANLCYHEGRWQEVEVLCESIAIAGAQSLGPTHDLIGSSLLLRARGLIHQGRWSDAQAVTDNILNLFGTSRWLVTLEGRFVQLLRSQIFLTKNLLHEAEMVAAKAIQDLGETCAKEIQTIVCGLECIAKVRYAQGRLGEAIGLIEDCLRRVPRAFAPGHFKTQELQQLLNEWKGQAGEEGNSLVM